MAHNIIIIGFMGTGKSAVGRKLAKLTHQPFIDIDKVIEQENGLTLTELFAEIGEAKFREMETETIRRLGDYRGVILSTGGGAPILEENMMLLKSSGKVFRLIASPETIYERVKPFTTRPMLLNVDNPLQKIKDMLAEREQHYAMADFHIQTEGKTLHETARTILNLVRSK